MLAMFVGAVEATIVTTAMPSIASDLGGFSRYPGIFSSYLLMSTVIVLVYGKLAIYLVVSRFIYWVDDISYWVYFMWFCCFNGAVNRI